MHMACDAPPMRGLLARTGAAPVSGPPRLASAVLALAVCAIDDLIVYQATGDVALGLTLPVSTWFGRCRFLPWIQLTASLAVWHVSQRGWAQVPCAARCEIHGRNCTGK